MKKRTILFSAIVGVLVLLGVVWGALYGVFMAVVWLVFGVLLPLL